MTSQKWCFGREMHRRNRAFIDLQGQYACRVWLLGMDFLLKCKANIDLGDTPGIHLAHHQGQTAFAPLLKSNLKAKPFTHIAHVNEITIPLMHFPAVAPLLRSHHLPRLYLASVRRRRNGSVSVGGISRTCC